MSTGHQPQTTGSGLRPTPPSTGSGVQPPKPTTHHSATIEELNARADMWNSFKLLAEALIPIVAKIRTDFEAQKPD